MPKTPQFRRYVAQLSFGQFRAMQVVEIDPTDPDWAPYLEKGWLVPDTASVPALDNPRDLDVD